MTMKFDADHDRTINSPGAAEVGRKGSALTSESRALPYAFDIAKINELNAPERPASSDPTSVRADPCTSEPLEILTRIEADPNESLDHYIAENIRVPRQRFRD